MKKVAAYFTAAVGVVAVAVLFPGNALAFCPNSGQQVMAQCGGGGEVLVPAGDVLLKGDFWEQGAGLTALDPTGGQAASGFGIDAGLYSSSAAGSLGADGQWLVDFIGDGSSRCIGWDLASFGSDGCPDGATPMWVVVSDASNRAFLVSVAGAGGPAAGNYDFSFVNNGAPSPNFGGAAAGLDFGRAVHVTSSSTVGGDVTVNVAPLSVPHYDDIGGSRTMPGVRLRGTHLGAPTNIAGAGGGSIVVDKDTDLCWDVVDVGYTTPLGCVKVGGLTPSQNVINGKAELAKGGAKFSWDVTAQFDVLGFNIYQKNITKGTQTKVNPTLIPLSGENDAASHAYTYMAERSDLHAVRGGFEIELVRQNGQTSRAPVTVTK